VYRIDNNSAVPQLPIVGAPGSAGFFSDGNPAAGFEATIVDAWWLNTVQEEICNVVLGANMALDKAQRNQLLLAINLLTSRVLEMSRSAYFDTPGTVSWVCPPGVTSVRARIWGGGGGGGGASNNGSGGGGGGAGYSEGIVSVVPGNSYPVVVGAGGTAGTTAPTAGGIGGTSSFAAISATGGNGGLVSTGGATGPSLGGQGSGGTILNVPGAGGAGGSFIASSPLPGTGGGTFATSSSVTTVPSAGSASSGGAFPGGGGTGGLSASTAGAGSRGMVTLEWFELNPALQAALTALETEAISVQ